MNKIREQKLAALGSCVTIRIVRPRLRLISCNFSMSKRADFVSNAPVGTALLVQSISCDYPHSYPLYVDKIKARRRIVRLASLLLQNYRHYSSMYSTSFGSPLMKYPSSVLYIGFPSTSITCVTIFSVNAAAPLTASLLKLLFSVSY